MSIIRNADVLSQARAAEKPAYVNLTIAGDFHGDATIFIDGVETAKTKLKSLALGAVAPGERVFGVVAQKGSVRLEAEKALLVKSAEAADLSITVA